jgi:hypothetical protein
MGPLRGPGALFCEDRIQAVSSPAGVSAAVASSQLM